MSERLDVLRLGYRRGRDPRITTHLALVARAMGADGLNDLDGAGASGGQALAALTDGQRNVAVGYQSLYTNSTGASNTALGYRALKLNATTDNLSLIHI